MKSASEANFKRDYQSHLKYLKLKGLQPKTIEAYSRAIRRIGDYFDQQITDLTEQQLTDYFSQLLESHSWSAVKLDLYGLKFFYQHVLHKPWGNVDLIKPPKTQRLPDIVSVNEARQLFQTTLRQVVAECGIRKRSHPTIFGTVSSLICWRGGYDIRTVQVLLEHADVSTTMIHTYVLNRGGKCVVSPLDQVRSS